MEKLPTPALHGPDGEPIDGVLKIYKGPRPASPDIEPDIRDLLYVIDPNGVEDLIPQSVAFPATDA